MEKVFVGYPHGGKVDGAFAKSLLDLQRFEDRNPSDRYELIVIDHAPGLYVAENRNTLVRMAQQVEADWLLQLDGDETFDPTLLRIIMRGANKNERPIIVGLYANVGNVNQDNAGAITLVDCIYAETADGCYINLVPPDDVNPFKVPGAAGAGIMLTHMSVFQKLAYPWFYENYIRPIGSPLQFMNEDISFSRLVREAGYEIWCDPLAQAIHWKVLPISPSTLRGILTKAQEYRDSLDKEHAEKTNMDIPGWISKEEALWLYEQASKMTSVVEVGSWMGRSTYSLLRGCKGTVFAVDHFQGSPSEIETNHAEAKTTDIHKAFVSNVGHFPNLRILKEDSVEASKKFFDRSVEMVFIDGEHTEEAFSRDLDAWIRKCSKLLCGHDRDEKGVSGVLLEKNLPYQEGVGSMWYVEL